MKKKEKSEEDRNSWGCVGLALTTGMHEEAASIPPASGWFRDTTELTAQQPTCKAAGLPHPRLFWSSLPLWWLSLSNHTNRAGVRKTCESEASEEEGRKRIVSWVTCYFNTSGHYSFPANLWGCGRAVDIISTCLLYRQQFPCLQDSFCPSLFK